MKISVICMILYESAVNKAYYTILYYTRLTSHSLMLSGLLNMEEVHVQYFGWSLYLFVSRPRSDIVH